MPRKNLTAGIVANATAPRRSIQLRDTQVHGLICRVRSSGRKVFELIEEKGGKRRQRTLGVWPHMTVKMARELALKLLGEATAREAFPERVQGRDTLRTFALKYFAGVNLRAPQEARRVLDADWAELLDKPLRDLDRGKIEEIRSRWFRAGAAAATVNRKSTVLRGILSRAVEWGNLLAHPMKGIKPLHIADDARVRTLSAEERGRLYGVIDAGDCDPAFGTAIYLLLNTGARMGELRGLRPADVDLPNRMVSVRATTSKVAKSRHIPMNSTLAERLETHPAWATPTRRQWNTIMKHARIADFTPHHSRHDFLSRLANSGVPVHVVAAIAGHSSIVMTGRYYLHMSDDAVRAAVEKF